MTAEDADGSGVEDKETNEMPRGDGTGPAGKGPLTGCGTGFCILSEDPDAPENLQGFAGRDGRPVKVSRTKESADRAPFLIMKEAPEQTAGNKEVSTMPRGDGTGPAGMGPMTGRAAGYCAGYGQPGFTNPIPGRGFGLGRGRGGYGRGLGLGFRGGRGAGWAGYYGPAPSATAPPAYGAVPTRQQELDALKGQAEYLQDTLQGIQERIGEIEKETGQEQ